MNHPGPQPEMVGLPMIDLHHHFDGAFDINHLYAEAQRRGLPQARLTQNDFMARCQVPAQCRTLTEFLAVFEFFYNIAQNADFLYEEARMLPARMAEQGIIYLETRFGPHLFSEAGLSPADVTEAVLSGLANNPVVPVRLILCAMRNVPVATVSELIDLYERFADRGVCGIDLAGDESRYACREYAPVFDRARALGIPVTIHAGEAAGPESVRDALDLFHARRIGHGIRSIEDPALVDRLVTEGTPLEVCLTSNLQTGNAEDYAHHPFEKLRAAGVAVTINTDDPSVSGIQLSHEWNIATQQFGLTRSDQEQILQNSVKAAFCEAALRQQLVDRVKAYFA